MKIEQEKSLKALHTFGLNVSANAYVAVRSEEELKALLPLTEPYLILGGGSNLLFIKDYEGCIIHNQIKGIQLVEEDETMVLVQVGGGEVWHELVLWCIEQGYGGIENLSLIPGTVGAAPIQNIGAYGVELKDVFYSLESIHLQTGEKQVFEHKDCQFGYRDSVFKRALKGQYCITKVYLKLSKQVELNLSYGAISKVLEEQNVPPSIQTISQAVITIRNSKLPNPKEIGNAGSFFKNPVIPIVQFEQLKERFPNIPSYPVSDTQVKVPAGWLIDQLGYKGYRDGDAGVHKNQALVLVNHGNADGQKIWELAKQIQAAVLEEYQIEISPEVNVIR